MKNLLSLTSEVSETTDQLSPDDVLNVKTKFSTVKPIPNSYNWEKRKKLFIEQSGLLFQKSVHPKL